MATFTTSITLPNTLHLRNVAGEAINLDLSRIPANTLADILQGGAKIILSNSFNSGKERGVETSDTVRLAQMQKRMDSWYRGEYTAIERAESAFTAMREQYVDERRAATGQTRAEVEKAIKATVAQVFGKDETATFSRFLDAVAAVKAKANGSSASDERAEIEAALAKRTAEAAAKRAEAAKDLDLTDIGL